MWGWLTIRGSQDERQVYLNKTKLGIQPILLFDDNNVEERTANMKNVTTILVWGPNKNEWNMKNELSMWQMWLLI